MKFLETQKILIIISVIAIVFKIYATYVGLCLVLGMYSLIFICIILASFRQPKIKNLYIISILIIIFWFFKELSEFFSQTICVGRSLWIPMISLIMILVGSYDWKAIINGKNSM